MLHIDKIYAVVVVVVVDLKQYIIYLSGILKTKNYQHPATQNIHHIDSTMEYPRVKNAELFNFI